MKKNKQILIIDDSSTNNLLCKMLFEDEGYNVILTENSCCALKKLKKNTPDIILLDINLPDEDGFSVLNKLRTEKDTQNIPIVMVTARDDRQSYLRAKELGATEYVTKPIGTHKLFSKVENILKKAV